MVLPKSSKKLTPGRKRLVSLIQDLYFGAIREVIVVNGEPRFTPPPLVCREIKLGAPRKGPRPGPGANPCCKAMAELLDHLDAIQTGLIQAIVVRKGMPVLIQTQAEYRPTEPSISEMTQVSMEGEAHDL